MANVNCVHLIGNVGKNPESKSFDSGTTKTSFSMATTKKIKDKQVTQWHNIVAWGKVAEIIDKYVKKGDPVYVQGEITYRRYEDHNSVKYITEINCNQVQLLGKKSPMQSEHEDAEIFPSKETEPDPFDLFPAETPKINHPGDEIDSGLPF